MEKRLANYYKYHKLTNAPLVPFFMNFLTPSQPINWSTCRLVWLLLIAMLAKNTQAQNPSGGSREFLNYNGRYAQAPASVPMPVHRLVDAANRLQGKPYVWGGGHRHINDRGYDCSGSVSYVLHNAGLLEVPLQSREFMKYGEPGPGRYITIYMRNGHVFMSVLGLRFDTSDMGSGQGDGPRWRPKARSMKGYSMRHPAGF